jgi:hypothetical protein
MPLVAPLFGLAQHLGKAPAHALHDARPLRFTDGILGVGGFVIDLVLIYADFRDQKNIHS